MAKYQKMTLIHRTGHLMSRSSVPMPMPMSCHSNRECPALPPCLAQGSWSSGEAAVTLSPEFGNSQLNTRSDTLRAARAAEPSSRCHLLCPLLWLPPDKWQMCNSVMNPERDRSPQAFRMSLSTLALLSFFLSIQINLCLLIPKENKWCWVKMDLILFYTVLVLLILDLYDITTRNFGFDHRILG